MKEISKWIVVHISLMEYICIMKADSGYHNRVGKIQAIKIQEELYFIIDTITIHQ